MAGRLNVALESNAGLPLHVVLPSITLRSRKDAFPIFHIKRDTTESRHPLWDTWSIVRREAPSEERTC
jgi:hypothetical protein